MSKLTARKVETAKCEPGQRKRKLAAGQGLHLIVLPNGQRDWFFIFTWHEPGSDKPRRPEMNLGRFPDVSLVEARALAADARRLVREGVNPIERRKSVKHRPGVPTFGEIADEYFEAKKAEYRNEKYREMVRVALTRTAAPLRSLPVDQIDTEAVLSAIKPVWVATPETGKRFREKIEAVLDAATAKGLRTGENPARWKNHLRHLLPQRLKVEKKHHAAIPYSELPEFIGKLRNLDVIAARALEFCILTATRSGEVYGARWSEIDLEAKVWTVPAKRMKAGREHRIPLNDRAVEILTDLRETRTGDLVFPSPRGRDKQLSHIAMAHVLHRMKIEGVTVHGFRSAFRDWCGNETHFPREVAEAALAHVVGDAAEQAYRRSDASEKRRALMDAWASYLDQRPNVISLDRTIGGAA